jgi:hypothetical protein
VEFLLYVFDRLFQDLVSSGANAGQSRVHLQVGHKADALQLSAVRVVYPLPAEVNPDMSGHAEVRHVAVRPGRGGTNEFGAICRFEIPGVLLSGLRRIHVALTSTNEAEVRCRYRLLGSDEHWTETARNQVRYAELPPGNYQFEVLGRNAFGRWSNTPARLAFSVLPHKR